MRLTLETPTRLYIDDIDPLRLDEVKANLTYRDKKVQYELQKAKKSSWLQRKLGEEQYQAHLADLKSREKVCLLEQDADGRHFVLSGMKSYLEDKYKIQAKTLYSFPAARSIPWAKVPTRTPYPYQDQAKERLLEAFHARVEMGTGLGKSFIILNLVKDLGLKTVIMAPSQSIAEQLYDEFLEHFGKKYVGAFFDGKKDFKKLFVIGTGQSLTRVTPDSPAGEAFAQVQVFIADESHQCPATTLAKVCTGVLQNAPYRYFFSATQIRNDGKELLLDAITGKTVYEMTVREGVDQGYLAKPVFRMIFSRSPKHFQSDDANEMTREHLYYNPTVLAQAGEVINLSVEQLGHQVLVLIDEVEQFTRLLPFLRHKVAFAHGPLQPTTFHEDGRVKVAGNREKVPKEYQESDNAQLVRDFNAGKIPILIGTSCISTGTDIRANKTLIYLRGGKSEIEVRQGVGRCTRLEKSIGKTHCTVVDFWVLSPDGNTMKGTGKYGQWVIGKHAAERKAIYEDIYGPVEEVDWS